MGRIGRSGRAGVSVISTPNGSASGSLIKFLFVRVLELVTDGTTHADGTYADDRNFTSVISDSRAPFS